MRALQARPAAACVALSSRAGRAAGVRCPAARPAAAARRCAPFPARCIASSGDEPLPADDASQGGVPGRGDAPGGAPVGGNAALQDELVSVLRFETAKRAIADQVSDYVAGEQDKLRALVEQGKEELDALEQASADRSALEFGAAMADINAMADEFSAGLRADKEAALEELAEFEAQASRDMNAYLPYQNLYQPVVTRKKKKPRQPLDAAASAAADAEAAAVAAATRSALGPAARGGAYAAAAGAIIALLGAAATGPGLSTVQLVIGTLVVSALGFQVWLAANGGLDGGDGDRRH